MPRVFPRGFWIRKLYNCFYYQRAREERHQEQASSRQAAAHTESQYLFIRCSLYTQKSATTLILTVKHEALQKRGAFYLFFSQLKN